MWSDELDSWLVPDGAYLRFYDADYNRHLTETEAERAAKEAEHAALTALLEKLRQANIDPDKL